MGAKAGIPFGRVAPRKESKMQEHSEEKFVLNNTEPGRLIINPIKHKYRCPSGHEFETEDGVGSGIRFRMGEQIASSKVCLLCLCEWLNKNIPQIEQID